MRCRNDPAPRGVDLGRILLEEGDEAAALRALSIGLEHEDSEVFAKCQLLIGVVLRDRDDPGPAKNAFREAMNSPDLTVAAHAFDELARVLVMADDADGAEEAAVEAKNRTLEASPLSWVAIGSLLSRQGKFALAEDLLVLATNLGDDAVAAMAFQCLGYIYTPRLAEAEAAFRCALAAGDETMRDIATQALGHLAEQIERDT